MSLSLFKCTCNIAELQVTRECTAHKRNPTKDLRIDPECPLQPRRLIPGISKGSRVKQRASKGERRRQALLVRARNFHLLFRIKRFAFIQTMAGPPYVGCDSGISVYFLDKSCMCNSLLHAGPSTVEVKLTALRECSGYYCVNVARPWDPGILSNTFGCCCEGIF